MIILPQPPRLYGDKDDQLRDMQKYITELYETLSIQLNAINIASFDEETRELITGGNENG